MKILRTTYLVFLFLGCYASAVAQVDSLRIDSVIVDTAAIVPVTLPPPGQDAEAEEEELFTVVPWEFHRPMGAELTETDSTLRWQNWPDWTYKLNRDPGIISYRMGTSIRSNAVQRNAHEPRHQQLYWEGISLNDPVSGTINWSVIPQHKIGEFYNQELGTEFRSTYYLRQYYLNEPLSRLIYSESQFNNRNLEFEVSHNLSKRTNLEVSYWDRRTGGEYPNSEITGRQIFGKLSHHLDENRYLKLNYISNNYDVGRPFGYVMSDMRLFNFDRFSALSNENSGRSQETSNLLALNYYQRSADSTVTTDNFHTGLYYRSNERSITYSADTTEYKVPSAGVTAKKWWSIGGFSLEGSANFEHFFNQLGSNATLSADNWSLLETEGRLSLDYTPIIDLQGGANFKLRTDGFQAYRLNATSEIEIGPFSLKPGISSGAVMPTPQQLYWNSGQFQGEETLNNEKIQEVRGKISYTFNPQAIVGIRGQHKDIADGIMVVDSSFTNVSNYGSQSATAFFEWDLTNFEFDGSATVHRFTNSFTDPNGTVPMDPTERIWLKGGAYWKGYLFDRATYVKAGLSGMLAPFRYQADHYHPELDYWQPISNDQQLPFFSRLDVDISARVRSIIFVLRWENVLDDVNQLGYFETAQYPMSQRRFMFGVRALFRN